MVCIGLTGEEHRSDWCATTQSGISKRRTRIGIARLVSMLSKFAVVGHPPDGAKTKTSKFVLKGHVSLVS
jgi:hypothetical protein